MLGNLGGALLTFLYFHDVDPAAVRGGAAVTGAEIVYFVLAFGLLFAIGRQTLDALVRAADAGGPVPPPGPAATGRAGARC